MPASLDFYPLDPSTSRGIMIIHCRDPFSRLHFSHAMPYLQHQRDLLLNRTQHIQNIVPHLSADERELFITGMLPSSLGESDLTYTCCSCLEHVTMPTEAIGGSWLCPFCNDVSNPFAWEE